MTCKINADTSDGLKIVSDTSGNVDIQNNGTTKAAFTANSLVLSGAGTETKSLEIGSGRTGDGASFVDLIGDSTYGDYGGRLLRNGGANSATELVHRGTGQLAFVAQDAGLITLKTSNTERARIDSAGVFMSQATAAYSDGTIGKGALQVDGRSGARVGMTLRAKNSDGSAFVTSAVGMMGFVNGNGTVGTINTSGSATSFNTSSDYRLKENVAYTFDATTRLKQLKPARFNFIADADTTVDGFLAHEVSSIVPEAITGTKDAEITTKNNVINANGHVIDTGIKEADWTEGKEDGVYPSDSTWAASTTKPDYQSIDQSKLVPLLVKTIQELEARITALES